MAIKGIFYVFALVSNLERSKKFYGDILGWKLSTDEKNVAGFAFGNGYLVIHADESQPGNRKPGGMHVEVQVDDVNAEHTRLRELGVEVSPLQDQHWGERNFYFSDPDAYTWFYGQATRAHE
jgi:catechol 2,3-dioxygenase-like lactoylglutathione lyase family enzyme